MILRSDVLSALAVMVGVGLAVQADLDRPSPTMPADERAHQAVSFSGEVMPILEQYCWECHSDENAELGLRLDTYEGMMLGSDYGTVVEAGDPDGSLLVDMMEAGDMPEEGDPVPPEQIEVIRMWIAEGAENN